MNIDFYGLPEFIAYFILWCISLALIRQQRQEPRMKYWFYGWLLILLHSGIFMLFPSVFPFAELARGTLALAGQMFILAAYFQGPATIEHTQLVRRMSLPAALNIIFIVVSPAYSEMQPTQWQLALFYVFIALGAICTARIALADKGNKSWHASFSVGLTLVVYAIQAAVLHLYGLVAAGQWLMCWIYLAVAYFFVRQSAKISIGIIATSLSFILWGLVFPIYQLFETFAPEIAGRIDSEVWNLPKFLAAASIMLILLEERVAYATHLANHDELTGLPNRRLYNDRFEQAVMRSTRYKSGFGLMVIDLNGFKQVNDTLGHEAGDAVLKAVSARFLAVLRSVDTLARTGGDEFTVILDNVSSVADADIISLKLQQSLDVPVLLAKGLEYCVKASFGVAVYPQDGTTQIQLHTVADERMYIVKQQFRNKENT